jgi:hypothetical protein
MSKAGSKCRGRQKKQLISGVETLNNLARATARRLDWPQFHGGPPQERRLAAGVGAAKTSAHPKASGGDDERSAH